MSIEDAKMLEFRKISDPKGNLTAIEGGSDVPFDIQRVFYLYDVPGGEARGGHAHTAPGTHGFEVTTSCNATTVA